MLITHMALGGCLKAPPVAYGLTEDTGGHVAYVLGAAAEQAKLPRIDRIEIVTRAFDDPVLGVAHARPRERVDAKTEIVRLRTGRADYLKKDDLETELAAIEAAFLAYLAGRRRPDVIHAHFADAACIALAARARWGIPVIYTPHSLGLSKLDAFGGRTSAALDRRVARERRAIAESDAIVVSSRDEAERQLDAYDVACAGRVHRVNPGVRLVGDTGRTDRAEALVDGAFTHPNRPLILAVARPVAKKNLGALVEAYATTPGLGDAANLAIVAGQATDPTGAAVRGDLAARAARHGLVGRFALPPAHDATDVPELYRLAAKRGGVFVNPALHEPFGLTVIEAASARLPVVVTDEGGPREIVAAIGHGACVPPTDVAAIGRACLETVTDRALWATRSAAAARGMGAYDWGRYAARTVDLYDRLARPARTASRRQAGRLLVTDIDGTLTGDRAAAARFATWVGEEWAGFAVATGRSLPEARHVLGAWDLPEPRAFVTSVGSEIWHADGAGRAAPDSAYAEAIAPGWDGDAVTAILAAAGARPQPAVEQRRFKRSYLGDAAEALRLRGVLKEAGLRTRVIASHGALIDVLPAGTGNGAAMRHLARSMGLAERDCIVAGDGGNDVCLRAAAGAAIVPANALRELTAPSADGRLILSRLRHADGVLDGLARLGLTSRPMAAVASLAGRRA